MSKLKRMKIGSTYGIPENNIVMQVLSIDSHSIDVKESTNRGRFYKQVYNRNSFNEFRKKGFVIEITKEEFKEKF